MEEAKVPVHENTIFVVSGPDLYKQANEFSLTALWDDHNVISLKMAKRREVLAKKRANEELIKAAYVEKDDLDYFRPFRHYDRNGLSVYLASGRGNKLSIPVKHYIQNLLKLNMEGPYGSEWEAQEKVKRREMVAPEARYIFVHEVANTNAKKTKMMLTAENTSNGFLENGGPLVGFVQYRFIIEEEIPVLYVYELQLEPRVQGKELGKFLMQLLELIAHKNCMGAVMLTVQKANILAMNFYISKLRYVISTVSPSRINPGIGIAKSYEILCKTFNDEAKTILEAVLVNDNREMILTFSRIGDELEETARLTWLIFFRFL
ncbi:N-alpha-acetyltransferase 40-like isoform X1 [Senna tora]|uniref:N-alpha-acetyltransferase 40 n=1 Tax=Senna tora TaxID=362788 RepID=A0A834TQE9_9FABA|nr:N-alpha-acetyltransferase 40-like isoform X1 [Senna tora]